MKIVYSLMSSCSCCMKMFVWGCKSALVCHTVQCCVTVTHERLAHRQNWSCSSSYRCVKVTTSNTNILYLMWCVLPSTQRAQNSTETLTVCEPCTERTGQKHVSCERGSGSDTLVSHTEPHMMIERSFE